MKFFFLLCSILIFKVSCQESPEVEFNKNGYSFTCPEGWSVIKETGSHKAGVIKVAKDGISGVYVLINDWNEKKDIGVLTKYLRTEIKNNGIFKFMNVEVGSAYDHEYAENPATSFDFTAYLGTAQIYGKVYIFHGGDKTFVISEYNKRTNEVSGFRKIEETLKY